MIKAMEFSFAVARRFYEGRGAQLAGGCVLPLNRIAEPGWVAKAEKDGWVLARDADTIRGGGRLPCLRARPAAHR
jgi:hypothetical protein